MVHIPENYQCPRGMARVPGGNLVVTWKSNGADRTHTFPIETFDVDRTHYRNGSFRDEYMVAFKDRRLSLFGVSPTSETTLLARGATEKELSNRQDHLLVGQHASDTPVIVDVVPKTLPSPKGFDHDDQPVTNVNWWTAKSVAHARGLRLLTANEHEYVARCAGTRLGAEIVGSADGTLREVAGTPSGLNVHCSVKIPQTTTALVGSYPGLVLPNDEVVHDICSNVMSWCERYVSLDDLADRVVAIHTDSVNCNGALGGAAWLLNLAPYVFAGRRDDDRPGGADDFFGFRCARRAPGL